jgi:chromosome segregation ATPase
MPRSSAASASAPAPGRNRTVTLLGILSGLLLLALLASGALAYVELDRRQARERALEEQIATLSQANRDFQAQVQSLTSERDQLSDERDRLQSRLNELMATNAEQEKRIQELTGQVQEQSRQLSQVREEATRQQQRAETAENIGSILRQIVLLDDQIHNEFDNLIDAMTDMQNAYRYGDRITFANAYERGLQAARRLDQLFAQRDQLLKQLGF